MVHSRGFQHEQLGQKSTVPLPIWTPLSPPPVSPRGSSSILSGFSGLRRSYKSRPDFEKMKRGNGKLGRTPKASPAQLWPLPWTNAGKNEVYNREKTGSDRVVFVLYIVVFVLYIVVSPWIRASVHRGLYTLWMSCSSAQHFFSDRLTNHIILVEFSCTNTLCWMLPRAS